MKISEIIEELKSIEKSHGDLQVRLCCDLGQELMMSTHIDVSSIEYDSYTPEYGDQENYDIKVVEIQAY